MELVFASSLLLRELLTNTETRAVINSSEIVMAIISSTSVNPRASRCCAGERLMWIRRAMGSVERRDVEHRGDGAAAQVAGARRACRAGVQAGAAGDARPGSGDRRHALPGDRDQVAVGAERLDAA